ncbi:nucleotidyl transferase AbiEii/AbiGii toxin family protein [Sulfuricurvum sp.]|uniref:nucleotidyl transferase AbiEii/AbiGii toxin family protein n=1 Tax=Sulfuricurvum sp. TaxID=2025608 RepID=UPI0019BF49AB|nr:nucleotidyl transferase AbiEii/AbiGii toxin family protein [Sulfuricurvum sp.]MBD3798841.1 nucleotidyl transferase AbiEii/AbiGii toxin family protein [Campylobacterota bacterium]MBD3806226.1 nucleotidyl transferase AbiEii/AbiGii toxin family protein [Sulfuricurvum sp.]
MTDAAKELLERVKDDPLFQKYLFLFVGGTALSHSIGHRISEDLDFAFTSPLPVFDIKTFAMRHNGVFVSDPKTSAFMINSGVDFDTRFIRLMIDRVKVEFFFPEDHFSQMCLSGEHSPYGESHINVLNPTDVSKMKVKALMDRVKIRDLYDITVALDQGILSEEDFFTAVSNYIQKDETWVLERISSMKEQKGDESLYFADNKEPPTFEVLKKSLFDRLDHYLKKSLLETDKVLEGFLDAARRQQQR